ncbi:MAG: C39 family peptidase [Pseudomonadota bacterium]
MRSAVRITLAACVALMLGATGAGAGDVITLPGRTTINVPVTSYFSLRFKQVVRQAYDVSCGAAALATLLTYYYGMNVSEKEIIERIFEKSTEEEKKKINALGFSMLELKRMGEALGFAVGGFRLDSVEKLAKLKVPAITLTTVRGYKHFVVLKGLSRGQVFIADPAFGNRSRSLERFAEEWDNVILVMVSDKIEGRNDFSPEGSLTGRAQEILPLLDNYVRPITRGATEF